MIKVNDANSGKIINRVGNDTNFLKGVAMMGGNWIYGIRWTSGASTAEFVSGTSVDTEYWQSVSLIIEYAGGGESDIKFFID